MTRQTRRDPGTFTAEQRTEYESLLRSRKPRPDGTIGGPFDPWLLNPEMSHRLRGLGVNTVRVFLNYYVPQAVMDDVYAGRRPNGTPEQVLVYDVCMAMHIDHRLSRPLYESATAAFGERGLAEIMAAIGYYVLVSMTLNAFEVEVAPGTPVPFAREP